ncbi:hypothetical protein LTR70_009125 [Exophiala xenobiotica]|uniref:MYND-type domain-containing protein n=1 Tax=Lithohypha guttulata TaxID=1690604 RepID=A0ABR0K0V9_9EURO|nr:hypothetical protein LTR24_008154 [Lithohypha guttulata]KAK5310942.1 hypothetical protein LTR70_009125 [Exophiala xenobiotica]
MADSALSTTDLETSFKALVACLDELDNGQLSLSRISGDADDEGPHPTYDSLLTPIEATAVEPTPNTEESRSCAVCEAHTERCCKACSHASLLSKHVQKRTYYCSKPCQEAHWQDHKASCKNIRNLLDRQSLSRAVQFLQRSFYIYREAAFDLSIKSINFQGNTVVIHEGPYVDNEILPGFPHDLVKSQKPEVKNMLLTMMSCSDMFIQIEKLCALLLKDTKYVKKIEELAVVVGHGPLNWHFHRHQGLFKSEHFPHTAYRVTLRDQSKWAIDLTAAQYGYAANLLPWKKYEQTRLRRILSISSFGTSSIQAAAVHTPGGLTPFGLVNELSTAIWHAQREIGKALEMDVINGLKGRGLTADILLAALPDGECATEMLYVLAAGKYAMEEFKKYVQQNTAKLFKEHMA